MPIWKRPVPILLLGAAALRLAVLGRGVGGISPSEQLLVAAADARDGVFAAVGGLAGPRIWTTLLGVLDRFAGEAAVTGANAPSLPPDPDPLVAAGRWLAAILGLLAVGFTAAAARRLGGAAAAWLAGALVALSPLALKECASAGPGSLRLLAAAGLLWGAARLGPAAGRGAALVAGAWGALAVAAGGGGVGLLAGLLAGGMALSGWLVTATGAVLLAPGILPALAGLPTGARAEGGAGSPLLAGILLLGGALGWPALALAVPGKLAALARTENGAGARAVVFATGGAFLVALLRQGPAADALTLTLPGLAVLAGLALGRVRVPGARRPAVAVVVLVALAAPAVGAARYLSASIAPHPARGLAEWLKRNAPDGSVILAEGVPLPLPTPDSIEQMKALAAQGSISRDRLAEFLGDGRSFHVVPLPPALADPKDTVLFYDPNLAARFRYLVLRDLPEADEPGDVIARTRRLFHEYFRRAYQARGRFGARVAGEEPLSIYMRGEGFELDRDDLAGIARILTSDEYRIRRDESRAFTDWALLAGTALLRGGDAEGARAYLGMAVERDPDLVEARYQYARALTLLDELDHAKQELMAGMARDPYHGGIHLHLGALLEQEGDLEGALTEYLAATRQLDDPAPAHGRMGLLLARIGRIDEARGQLAELRAMAPGAEVTRRLEGLLGAP